MRYMLFLKLFDMSNFLIKPIVDYCSIALLCTVPSPLIACVATSSNGMAFLNTYLGDKYEVWPHLVFCLLQGLKDFTRKVFSAVSNPDKVWQVEMNVLLGSTMCAFEVCPQLWQGLLLNRAECTQQGKRLYFRFQGLFQNFFELVLGFIALLV